MNGAAPLKQCARECACRVLGEMRLTANESRGLGLPCVAQVERKSSVEGVKDGHKATFVARLVNRSSKVRDPSTETQHQGEYHPSNGPRGETKGRQGRARVDTRAQISSGENRGPSAWILSRVHRGATQGTSEAPKRRCLQGRCGNWSRWIRQREQASSPPDGDGSGGLRDGERTTPASSRPAGVRRPANRCTAGYSRSLVAKIINVRLPCGTETS